MAIEEIEEYTTVKVNMIKKSRKEKDALQKTHKDEGLGDTDVDEDQQRKKKKKTRETEYVGDAEGGSSSIADIPVVEDEKTSKKKRKRRHDESNSTDASTSKKEKKKRKKDTDVEGVPETAEKHPSDEPAPLKKDKKKRKKDATADEATPELPTKTTVLTADSPSPSETRAFLTKYDVTIHAPESAGKVTPAISFNQLNIPSGLMPAFDGFKEPTPIQACSWPPALAGQDVVGIAETGSGKTLAFGLPALSRLITNSSDSDPKKSKKTTVTVLIMAPTRELAIQTHETLSALGEPFGIASVAVFGGVDKAPQVKTLKNANKDGKMTRIIVGTPGRILDLVNDGACDLSRVSYLVLDEADRMLDKGFENDIRSIIGYTKQGAERQTLMFSATWPEAVRRLAATFQRDPVRVTVGSDELTANSRVEQVVEVFDDARSKDSRLQGHLRTLSHKKSSKTGAPEDARVLVFVLYKKEASRVEGMLRSKGHTVGGLHGDMSQAARMEALHNFKTGITNLLVATDVAARGLDIPNVAAVINYTFPLTIEDYIHRIGRTGRGGKSGKSITFFTGDKHERALAGELARVLHESGFEAEGLKKFPMTIKKKTHGVYGAFFRDDIPVPTGPTKITFD
ncbi:ATP-dependent RNA helicase DBP3 [Sparassis crispa]|uniref:RNA helicase n=1 Tax=Sparassis crispa TaxID=139825 RepID=A0A401G932_9APHY|nr:ATP-dependent RNA helicase DBP3 [Sparassis crispa]GBE78675.1 ATP-dependent RNA helicase DBP3 [Sparassis crispa]